MSRFTNLTGLETLRKVVTTSGTPEVLAPRMTASTIAFVNNSGTAARDTITDSGSGFLTEGIRVGDVINITGSTSNNKQVEVYSVVAGTITITRSGFLVDELVGSAVTLSLLKGRPVPDGVSIVVKARSGNTGTITLGPTSARALNTNTGYDAFYSLTASNTVMLDVKNLDEVWMDSTVSGDGVEIIFEV